MNSASRSVAATLLSEARAAIWLRGLDALCLAVWAWSLPTAGVGIVERLAAGWTRACLGVKDTRFTFDGRTYSIT